MPISVALIMPAGERYSSIKTVSRYMNRQLPTFLSTNCSISSTYYRPQSTNRSIFKASTSRQANNRAEDVLLIYPKKRFNRCALRFCSHLQSIESLFMFIHTISVAYRASQRYCRHRVHISTLKFLFCHGKNQNSLYHC